MIENYYQILGIKENATFQEIKQAYRLRAKELHPDINKSPHAHDDFVLLTEAYEYLVNLKTGKIYIKNNAKTRSYNSYKRWQESEAESARRRAKYYADMQYDEFVHSDYYKIITSINVILGHLGFFLAIGILVIMPITLTVLYGWTGIIISAIGMFITLPVTVDAIRIAPKINLKEFAHAIYITSKTRAFFISVVTLMNVFIILKIGFQTLIPIYEFVSLFLGLILISLVVLVFFVKMKTYQAHLISFCMVPLALNILLVVNFLFSVNPIREKYPFTNEMIRGDAHEREWVESTVIILEQNKYSEFYGIRIFADLDKMKRRPGYSNKFKDSITYTFKDGLFGLRVMADYEFN